MLVQHGHSLYKMGDRKVYFSLASHYKAARHQGGGSGLQDLLENCQQYRKMISHSP